MLLLLFFQARDIYEEAVQTVITVRDFTQVFDAYAQFEKNLISAKMESMEEEGPTEEGLYTLVFHFTCKPTFIIINNESAK